jgi:hypothetical protein
LSAARGARFVLKAAETIRVQSHRRISRPSFVSVVRYTSHAARANERDDVVSTNFVAFRK